jgi:serine/threonine protein kinase/formylglycine-generating enzyme required for sulfatase activity
MDGDATRTDGNFATAEEAYGEFLRRSAASGSPDFAAFCARHPALSDGLRILHSLHVRGSNAPEDAAFLRELERGLKSDSSASQAEGQEAGREAVREAAIRRVLSKPSFLAPGPHRYAVKGEIARGGMSVVLEVCDEELDRASAMKVMLGRGVSAGTDRGGASPAAPEDGERLLRFLREAKVTAQLEHPGIPPLHALGTDPDGLVFFTMPVVRGQDLHAVFDLARAGKDGWSLPRAVGVLVKVCETLAYAHSRGVLHRDLKPTNVMVGPFGEVYVMDWGLAKRRGDAAAPGPSSGAPPDSAVAAGDGEVGPMTLEGAVIGTPGYIPPEQAAGRLDEVDERSDVYAVGAMLYQLLTGSAPYVELGKPLAPAAVLRAVLAGPPEPVLAISPEAPVELAAICEKAMARDRLERYASIREAGDDLRAFLENRVVRAHRTGPLVELRKWVVRNKLTAASMAAGLVLAMAGLAAAGLIESRAKDDLFRLTDAPRLATLEAEGEKLRGLSWNHAAPIRTWLAEARSLVANLPSYREILDRVRRRGSRSQPPTMATIPQWHPLAGTARERNAEVVHRNLDLRRLARLREQPEAPTLALSRPVIEARIQTLAGLRDEAMRERDSILASVAAFGHYSFRDPRDQGYHNTLANLVVRLELLEAREPAPGLVPQLEDVIEWVRVSMRDLGSRWEEAIAAVSGEGRHPLYAGVRLEKQVGFAPLGPDPVSGLWEFAFLPSGKPPQRGAGGGLDFTDESALVFVLLPAPRSGEVEGDDPEAAGNGGENAPAAGGRAGGRRARNQGPYFISKFEMTQGQWLRLTGRNPSHFGQHVDAAGRKHNLLHPVEGITWREARDALELHGLRLPSVVQWEHAARAETATAWSTGEARESLADHANLRDRTAREAAGIRGADVEEWLADGYLLHAPAGSFLPNAFGLHDTVGNVWEWTATPAGVPRGSPPPATAGPAQGARPLDDRFICGSSFLDTAEEARAGVRTAVHVSTASGTLGVRPAMELRPDPDSRRVGGGR